jgi:hypothetical protein
MVEMFTRAEALRHFGYDTRRRGYNCPVCRSNDESDLLTAKTAQLEPNTPDSTNVFCFVCRCDTAVTRKRCPNPGCKGNVLSVEFEECLTCGESLEDLQS